MLCSEVLEVVDVKVLASIRLKSFAVAVVVVVAPHSGAVERVEVRSPVVVGAEVPATLPAKAVSIPRASNLDSIAIVLELAGYSGVVGAALDLVHGTVVALLVIHTTLCPSLVEDIVPDCAAELVRTWCVVVEQHLGMGHQELVMDRWEDKKAFGLA